MKSSIFRPCALPALLISAFLIPEYLAAAPRRSRVVATGSAPATGGKRGVLRESGGWRPTIRYCRANRCRVLRRFRKPTSVRKLRLSPDGRFALLWYRRDGQARRLATYEVATGRQLCDFKPGFGGTLYWTPQTSAAGFNQLSLHCLLGRIRKK